jgi:hypothetical protein
MYTDKPVYERADAVKTLEAIRLLKAEPKAAPQPLLVAADACLKAANELIAAIDKYGQICQQMERESFTIDFLHQGAAAGKDYEAKRDAFVVAKNLFILSVE